MQTSATGPIQRSHHDIFYLKFHIEHLCALCELCGEMKTSNAKTHCVFLGLVLAAIVLPGSLVRAGDMQMFANIAGRFDSATMAPLDFSIDPLTGRVADSQPGIYKIDLSFTALN